MPRKPRKSFVGHPSVILFLLISRAGVFQQPRLLSTVTSELPVIHRSADHNLLRSGGQVIGTRVMLTATQEPRPDPRLLQDRGSWPALSSRRFPQVSGVLRRALLSPSGYAVRNIGRG